VDDALTLSGLPTLTGLNQFCIFIFRMNPYYFIFAYMKTFPILLIVLSFAMVVTSFSPLSTSGDKDIKSESFYQKSLHATNKGISFIYSKEQGGLERLTGKSAGEMGCQKAKCHASSCDDCHMIEVNGLKSYTTDTATYYKACTKCHGDMAKDNPDVHFAKGMKCMDCHTSKEIHGDGTDANTYQAKDFFDAKCENCHKSVSQIKSHTVHGNKLECQVCHSDNYTTCLNCHIESRLKGVKEAQFQLDGMSFLVNYNGKVTLANMLSYVYQGKTMITFAKTFGHSIIRQGRKCGDCHGSTIVNEIAGNKFRMTRWENDSLKNSKGVIPVLEGYNWNLVFLDKTGDKWIPLKSTSEPLLNYSGYCSPITKDQFEKLR
jgi:hypothetical protein